jgi:predicted kinase
MVSIQMLMAPLIILTGLPASGKSTLAAALAAATGWPLLSKDACKEPLMRALPALAAGHSRVLSDMSFELLFALLPEVLARAPGVLLEGNFRAGAHEAPLRAACASRPLLQLLFHVPEAHRLARLHARRDVPGYDPRHPAAGQAAYREECDRFLDLPGTRIQLGEAPLDVSLAAIRATARAHGFCV